jgi:hypothetical protein
VLLAAAPPARAATPLLPDLEQGPPRELTVLGESGHWRLGFESSVTDVGAGPLIVDATRPDRTVAPMAARQVVEQADGRLRALRVVGALRFVVSVDHRHWHMRRFMSYELWSADGRLVLRDRKTGFCLSDPAYTPDNCGRERPGLTRIRVGIGVGYTDVYNPFLEITRLRAGPYVLVHRSNPERRIAEQTYVNNASSVRLRLTRRGGRPRITVVRTCPNSPACP